MNSQLIPPPDHDLRPATRARQRDELVAIVDHESAAGTPHRRFVPLAAAAAVVAVTAGLALAVPALRGEEAQPPVAGQDTAAAKPAVEPLSEAEQATYGKSCVGKEFRGPKGDQTYTVIDGFRWVKPADPAASGVVLIRRSKGIQACAVDSKGQARLIAFAFPGETQGMPVVGSVAGTYTKQVTRITVAAGSGPTTEAVLRHGFFFAPLKRVDSQGRPAPDSPPAYTVRGYDADGKLIYATPQTYRGQQAEIDACFTDPEGKRVVYSNIDILKNPTVDQCKRGVAWNW
ncbi:hypothetical protein GCM10009789_53670 [Kribbella sancticallisti]|uniref:Uncharacterized protein n=1 Tax=Kribbella sancticallisti TaxID=460087 RepID=A0ABN2E115_9ACTN